MKYSHHKTYREVGRAKDLSASLYCRVNIDNKSYPDSIIVVFVLTFILLSLFMMFHAMQSSAIVCHSLQQIRDLFEFIFG